MADVQIEYSWPEPHLVHLVQAYWEVELAPGSEALDLLHPEAATLRVPLSGQWMFGARSRDLSQPIQGVQLHGITSKAQWVHGVEGRAFCIALKPFAFPALLRVSAAAWANRLAPAQLAIPQAFADRLTHELASEESFNGRVAVANGWISDLAENGAPLPAARLVEALEALLADPDIATVEQLCERAGLSQPQLARLTRSVFGFTPKLLIRRERFLRMLHIMELRPYAEWRDFIDEQYVDQSHMIRDFKDFLGMSPSRYFALDRPLLAAAFRGIADLLSQPVAMITEVAA